MPARLLGLDHGPESLTLVRHGESVGNLADAEAHRTHAQRLDLEERDADVPLSDLGHDQARAVADHLAGLADDAAPTLVVSSPYRRALETATTALGDADRVVLDERLRERDLGQLDGLTGAGIRHEFASEARRRAKVGKFYYQPPGGESWADVVLRVRSLLGDLRHGFEGERVWLFTHQAVIMSFRYVLEGVTEAELLHIDKEVPVPNCSITTYRHSPDGPVLERFGATDHLEGRETTVTREAAGSERQLS